MTKDKKECLVTFVGVMNRPNYKPFKIRLEGLIPDKLYKDEDTGKEYYGDILMNAGITINRFHGDARSALIHLKCE